jgi:murein DD-endopeptidase MepM/ murein hydrolase activator NlpD
LLANSDTFDRAAPVGSKRMKCALMSKPKHSLRLWSSFKFLPRFFPRQREKRWHEQANLRGRQQQTHQNSASHRRVRLVFFSTWGSDYQQVDLSATAFAGILLGIFLAFCTLIFVVSLAMTGLVKTYRQSTLTDDHQILRSRLNQMEARVMNLSRRANPQDGEENQGFAGARERNDLPAFINASDSGEMANDDFADGSAASGSGASKRGPLGLAWQDGEKGIIASEIREATVFFGQGGGAYIDEEDNIYPALREKERAHSAALAPPNSDNASGASVGGDLLSQLEQHISRTQEMQRTIVEKFEIRRKQLEHIPSIKPLLSGRITDLFGKRKDPFVYRTRHHQGLDIGAPRGTEVFAPANGVVELVKTTYRRNRGYGRAVVIDHGYGIKTLYGHLSEIRVKIGQKIERWDVLGLVGETGRATGPHLHYEVWVDGETCDPLRFILNN